MEIIVSTLAVVVAASCLIAFVRSDLKEKKVDKVEKAPDVE